MPRSVFPWLACAALAVALALVTTSLGRDDSPAKEKPSPARLRLDRMLTALGNHKYADSCKIWHPVVWYQAGLDPANCHLVLDSSFPPTERFVYRILYGGVTGKDTEAYTVEVATGQDAAACVKAWANNTECNDSHVFVFRLDLDNPAKSIGYKRGIPAGRHWYITGAVSV